MPDPRRETRDDGGNLRVRIAHGVGDLTQHKAAWHRLVERAQEPNFFYEPGPFMAAVDNLPLPGPLLVVLVFADAAGQRGTASELVGFFPFYYARVSPLGALAELRLYRHLHCFLCTPIVDAERARPVVDAMLRWFERNPMGVHILRLNNIRFDGPFGKTLQSCLKARDLPNRVVLRHHRALFRRSPNPEEFLQASLSAKRRKELRRLRKRLGELGEVSLRANGPMDNPDLWAEQFLRLEASGWKGSSRGGVALANERSHKRFFLQMVREAQTSGCLMMLSLDLDGEPIAQKCSFRASGSREAAFAFKIAHAEKFGRFSPGVQLEVANIVALHDASPPIEWMDSCALPNHPMIDHIWRDRREVVDVVCGSRTWLARALFPIRARVRAPI